MLTFEEVAPVAKSTGISWFTARRTLRLVILAVTLVGCRSYVESIPRQYLEGNHPVNYARIFREPTPSNVTVVNSAVVTYSFRPGVVTTDDFEFELIVPAK